MGNILTVVGRATSEEEFLSSFNKLLPDNYSVQGLHNLGEYYEADKKERYLAFIVEEIFEEKSSMETIARVLVGRQLGANMHTSIESAMEYAKEKYGFEDEAALAQEKFTEMRKEYPFFSAEEVQQFMTFNAFYHNGDIIPFRCKFNDELAIALVTVANAQDEVQVTPLGILFTDKMSEELLKMPFEEEE